MILPSGTDAIGETVDVTIARATMATLFAAPPQSNRSPARATRELW